MSGVVQAAGDLAVTENTLEEKIDSLIYDLNESYTSEERAIGDLLQTVYDSSSENEFSPKELLEILSSALDELDGYIKYVRRELSVLSANVRGDENTLR